MIGLKMKFCCYNFGMVMMDGISEVLDRILVILIGKSMIHHHIPNRPSVELQTTYIYHDDPN